MRPIDCRLVRAASKAWISVKPAINFSEIHSFANRFGFVRGSPETQLNLSFMKLMRPGAAHSVAQKHHKREIQLSSRTGTSSVKSQENKEPLNEEVQPTEQELGTESNIEVPNSALQLKEFWLNMDQLCDLFDIHPFEAIIGLSTICQWPPPLLKITERNWTPNQNTCPDSDHSFVTVNPPQARLIVEKVCCSRISGNPVKCLDINAHRAISLNLTAGRHCFSLIVCSPLGYRVTVLGSPVVTFSPASHVTPVLSEKTSDSLGPAVSREKSPRLSKLTKPRQRQPSPALVMETLFQPYQMELCDEDPTPEMNLAWRVLQWDWTTDNPLNVTYRTPRGPTPTSRSKGRMRSALGEKQAQSIRKEGSEEEFQVRWSQPIDPDTLIAVVRIQAVFRGYHTRLCMRLRSPQTMVSFLVPSLRANSLSDTPLDNCDSPSYIRMKAALMRKAKRVESGWSKCLELLHRGQTEREIGVDLVQMLLEQNELEFGKDLERYIACLDFTGSQPARPSSGALNITEECKAKTEVSPKVQDWVALLFRDILTIGPQNEPKDGGLTKNFRMRFRTDLPDCQVQVVNNDTGQEVYTVFTGTVHPVSLKLNGNGYSLLGIGGPSPAPEGRWLLRLMAPGRNGLNGLPQIQNDWQRPLCTAFKARELTGYYVPNEKALLFRRHVEESVAVRILQLLSMIQIHDLPDGSSATSG
ncbi:calpain-7-like protein [Clonorchis sinensis]|uniref:Calpain-7-like protein n=1 Tax=Clonorchis sinensis TaxID=79923 RepID=G7YUU6_CLOSI|nr:calpain-7-like protein [Clonorchis sinensis]